MRTLLSLVLILLVTGLAAPAIAEDPPVFSFKFGSTGSTGDGEFLNPTGMAFDLSGNIYVTDVQVNRVQKFTAGGVFISKFGSGGNGDGQFSIPIGLSIDSSGNLFISEFGNQRVQKFNSSEVFVDKWGTIGTADGEFNRPRSNALDGAGNIYVVDDDNSRVQKFDNAGNFIRKWGVAGSGDGEFTNPNGIAVNSAGDVFVSENIGAHRIQKFDSTGVFILKWGSIGSGDGQFNIPTGMTVDYDDNLYVVDSGNDRVQKFDSNGGFLTKWGTEGTGDGQFSGPSNVAIGLDSLIYVSDFTRDDIQVFAPPSGGDLIPPTLDNTFSPPADLNPGDMIEITWSASDNVGVTSIDLAYTADIDFYGSTSGNSGGEPGNLYSLNIVTGAGSLIGDTGFDRVGAIVEHPSSGKLIAAGERRSDDTPILLTIDPMTGVGTEIGPTGIPSNISDLGVDRITGTVYGSRAIMDSRHEINTFDITTGAATLVDTSDASGGGGGLGFSLPNTMFLAVSGSSAEYRLHQINRSTAGSISAIPLVYSAPFTVSPKIKAMDFHPRSGALYGLGADGQSTPHVVTINTSSGVVTDIGISTALMDGAAFAPSSTSFTIALGETNDGSYMWTVPDHPTNSARVKITVYDAAGNTAWEMNSEYFNILNDVSVDGAGIQAGTFLSSSYPNPFHSQTTIRFGLATAGDMRLAVYDAKGRLVREILHGRQQAGSTIVRWDGLNDSGRQAPSGFYVIRLETEMGEIARGVSFIR